MDGGLWLSAAKERPLFNSHRLLPIADCLLPSAKCYRFSRISSSSISSAVVMIFDDAE